MRGGVLRSWLGRMGCGILGDEVGCDCFTCWNSSVNQFDDMEIHVIISPSESRCIMRETEIYLSIAFFRETCLHFESKVSLD